MQILAQPQAESLTAVRNRMVLKAALVKQRGSRQSPLENAIKADRIAFLVRHAKSRHDSYYAALSGWRNKLDRYLLQSEDYFEFRKAEPNRNEGKKSIFDKQNDSLNLIGAFAEFFAAQAQNDLFGSNPWFAARPLGKADATLADQITKHATWKTSQARLTETYCETTMLAAILGTQFTRTTWMVKTDSFEESRNALYDAKTKKLVLTSTGDAIFDDDPILEEERPGQDEASAPSLARFPKKDPQTDLSQGTFEYGKAFLKQDVVTYRNIKTHNLHFRDIAFDPTAPDLDLHHTDFFHSFTKGVLDIAKEYDLTDAETRELYNAAKEKAESLKPETSRSESAPADLDQDDPNGSIPNIPVRLTEGFMRADALGKGQASNIYIVFAPQCEMCLKLDYLGNITPKGKLPLHSHTINRLPWRIVGRGFFERFDKVQTFVDDLFNRINWHDRKSSDPITGYDKSKLAQEDEEEDEPFNTEKPLNLKPDSKLEEAIQFKALPDLNDRTKEMLQMMIQMVQLRTGITAANQGDVAGLPEASTATGIKQLMSRAAVLLKSPIDQLKRSFTCDLEYSLLLLYTNLDEDETFAFGEGENTELIELKADAVRGLELNISLLLTQAQNQFKLENAKAAIDLLARYIQLPEHEKTAARSLFLQALRALDFQDADSIVRAPILDLQTLLAQLPPELQAQLSALMQNPQSASGLGAKSGPSLMQAA
ncbi:hypothetical protein [Verrucomicrobium sp. BvORR106]|uniref:portal protein n=1 Tax=Verrucomicrobium sp. BvORR106 TaxID=1403819 RepID=UPI00056DEC8D|nr:hypothetical protein [Verrucomicrobium sp. BvORR106]